MAEQPRNLWPVIEQTITRTPVIILREQASYLGQQTSNIILGDVKSEQSADYGLLHYFYLIAPALGNYRYLLMRVAHQTVEIYPLSVFFDAGHDKNSYLGDRDDGSINAAKISSQIRVKLQSERSAILCENEEEFENALAQVFSHERTQNIIRSLMAQSQQV